MKKTAIVTGGNSGLGYASAKKFCDNGFITYIITINPENTKEATDLLGENARVIKFDLGDFDGIPALVKRIQDEAGSIDVLLNNAGINMKKDVLEVSNEEFERIIKINMTAVFSLSREVAKVMKEQGKGSIVNISSMAAKYAIPGVIAYTASKTAIDGITRSMALDLAPHGIRVNNVAPGFITTPMTDKALNSDLERKNRVLSRTPMGKMGEPRHVADAVYFLASDEAEFITGQSLCVDGGNSIGF